MPFPSVRSLVPPSQGFPRRYDTIDRAIGVHGSCSDVVGVAGQERRAVGSRLVLRPPFYVFRGRARYRSPPPPARRTIRKGSSTACGLCARSWSRVATCSCPASTRPTSGRRAPSAGTKARSRSRTRAGCWRSSGTADAARAGASFGGRACVRQSRSSSRRGPAPERTRPAVPPEPPVSAPAPPLRAGCCSRSRLRGGCQRSPRTAWP